jgi:hypothetical protein
MKYVKLFENWLNEAEGEVKPFDPKAPGATLVVDINQEDLLKDPKETHTILQSMFNKGMAKKDKPGVEETIKVVPLYVGNPKLPAKDPYLIPPGTERITSIIVNDSEGNKYNVKVETGGSQLEDELKALQKNKTPIFLVTSSKNEAWHVDKDGVEIIQPSNEVVILLPENNQKWEIKAAKDFSLNVEFSILNGKKLSTSLISLGSIVKNIGNIASKAQLVNDKAATPIDVAGILGYEIPKDYTPKMGGVKKLEK